MSSWPRDRKTLSATSLRQILVRAAACGQEADHLHGDEGHEPINRVSTVAAAVLIALVDRPAGPTIVLTQRTAHLRAHAGQISFPGGRIEPEDAGAHDAALREAEEEIGLAPADAEILGELKPYQTVTGFTVHPIVAWVRPSEPFRTDPFEVEDVFEVPLDFVLDRANHQRDSGVRDGRRRDFYVLRFEQRYIWGATAAMLVNLARAIELYGDETQV